MFKCSLITKPFLELLIFFLNFYFAYKVYHNYIWISDKSLLSIAFLLCYYLFCSFLFFIFLYSFAHTFAIIYTSLSCLLMIFFIKIKQNCVQLVKLSKRKFSSIEYCATRQTYTSTLQYFFSINTNYGKLFFVTIIIFAPVNAMVIMWIVLGFVDLRDNGLVLFFMFYHFNFIFVLHLFLTYCTRNIHRLARVLIMLMVASGTQVGRLRSRMTLAHDIFALHTTKRLGFTYGLYGLISFILIN